MVIEANQSLISASHVSVLREGKRVLDDVSLAVHAKDFITIVGPNGAGKTTLLHVLLGFIKPDHGEVVRQSGVVIGFVPQRVPIESSLPMTVKRFLDLTHKASPEVLEETLETLGIRHLQQSMLTSLSGGEFQRVLLARALIRKPSLLILDEPAQNLDMGGQLAFYKILEKVYSSQQCAVVMVSHDIHMVMASSSKVVCLYHHVCCSGEPSMVTKDPKFQALFGEDVLRMMAVYQHAHTHNHTHNHTHEEESS